MSNVVYLPRADGGRPVPRETGQVLDSAMNRFATTAASLSVKAIELGLFLDTIDRLFERVEDVRLRMAMRKQVRADGLALKQAAGELVAGVGKLQAQLAQPAPPKGSNTVGA